MIIPEGLVTQWLRCASPYERYDVNEWGDVRDTLTNRAMTKTRTTLGKKQIPGYLHVSLVCSETGERKSVSVHRLVALVFVAGDHSLEVNHKDADKVNNHRSNLEWVTHQENIRHGVSLRKARLLAAAS